MNETTIADVARRLSEIEAITVERDVPAGNYCTYRVGGPLAIVATVDSGEALAELADVMSTAPIPALAIGRGSNLLVADDGFGGVAIVLGEGFAVVDIDQTTVRAGGATLLPVVARATVGAGLTGFEWAVGVPGSIGGAVRMNAGGHGSDMATNLVSAEVADLRAGGMGVRDRDELDLRYRHSNLRSWEIVAGATLELATGDPEDGAAQLREIVTWRRQHQPGGANAGSVFTNPSGASAGALIDEAGGKGRRIGSAAVSTKHANFIQVDPNGSAEDVMTLMEHLVDLVERARGIRLIAETRLVGFDPGRIAGIQPPAPPDDDTGSGR